MINKSRKGVIWKMMSFNEQAKIKQAINKGMTCIYFVDNLKGTAKKNPKVDFVSNFAYWVKEWDNR